MWRTVSAALVAAGVLVGCGGGGEAEPCDRSVDELVDQALGDPDDALDMAATLSDECPARFELFTDRLVEQTMSSPPDRFDLDG